MRWHVAALLALLASTISSAIAQERTDYQIFNFDSSSQENPIIEIDTTLFRLPIDYTTDPYAIATQYYRAQGSLRRRGLYYTTAAQIVEPSKPTLCSIDEPLPQTSAALYTAQSGYRIGLRAAHAQPLQSGWYLQSSIWAQSGRDMFVEGLFRNSVNPSLRLSRTFDKDRILTILAEATISDRSLQYGSTAEAFSLIGSNYYNPAWGFYNGEVRSSRIVRRREPSIDIHYQHPLSATSTLVARGAASYSHSANSSIGWYNANTPAPDYYRKMPSYMTEGEVRDAVTETWRTANSDYTQINWDNLTLWNTISPNGEAHYVVEDKVVQRLTTTLAALINTTLAGRVSLTYGFEIENNSTSNFKKMRDLLGADHLTDYDVFIDDSYNKSLPLDNNMANPDNKIYEGDRFGYDYTLHSNSFDAILRAQYRASRLDFNFETTIGSHSIYRTGHFEKERFAGSSSLGNSTTIDLAPYTIRASVGYAAGAARYFSLKLVSSRLSPSSNNLFLNASATNYLAPASSGEVINSAALAFRLNYPAVTLSGEIFALISRNGSRITSIYDDLSSTMCRASITQIGYCSTGVEITADLRLHSDLRLTATLAAGRYYYDTNPLIELYRDYDLSVMSSATPSLMSGINIGNAPQLNSTLTASYFGMSGYIFGASSSLAAFRYEEPSIARRSQRLLLQAFTNSESASAAMTQQRLGDIFDIEINITRLIYFDNDTRLSIRLAVSNLLGDNDRVYYAKESDRITLQSVNNTFTGATMRQGIMQYGAPRAARLSVSYTF